MAPKIEVRGGAGAAGGHCSAQGAARGLRKAFWEAFYPHLGSILAYFGFVFWQFVASSCSSFLLPQCCDACFLPALVACRCVASGLQL
mgnify:CR=1 FL=1